MNKQDIYALLNEKNIAYEVTEHEAVFTMEEASHIVLPYPECEAKNLFVRDDKKRNYYLITVKGDVRVNLKEFREKHNTRALSFASEQDLMKYLSLIPGEVTPFGLLNDTEHRVTLFLDETFMEQSMCIGLHPNDNTATVWMNVNDLIKVLREFGTNMVVTEI